MQLNWRAKFELNFPNWASLIIFFIVIDQLTKLLVAQLGWSVFLNKQFAFSLPVPVILMYVIYFAVFLGMSYFVSTAWQRFSLQQKLAWALIYAGGLSNVVERILLGHVRDFIFIFSGVLNLADFFILFGLILLLASTRREQLNNNIEAEQGRNLSSEKL